MDTLLRMFSGYRIARFEFQATFLIGREPEQTSKKID